MPPYPPHTPCSTQLTLGMGKHIVLNGSLEGHVLTTCCNPPIYTNPIPKPESFGLIAGPECLIYPPLHHVEKGGAFVHRWWCRCMSGSVGARVVGWVYEWWGRCMSADVGV